MTTVPGPPGRRVRSGSSSGRQVQVAADHGHPGLPELQGAELVDSGLGAGGGPEHHLARDEGGRGDDGAGGLGVGPGRVVRVEAADPEVEGAVEDADRGVELAGEEAGQALLGGLAAGIGLGTDSIGIVALVAERRHRRLQGDPPVQARQVAAHHVGAEQAAGALPDPLVDLGEFGVGEVVGVDQDAPVRVR